MNDGILEMARRSFGFGRWEAPYWFIGPEQGQGPHEKSDLELRFKAWHQLGRSELCDCRRFHDLIGESRWHRERPRLQSTWRPLLLLLATALARSADNDSLRRYQRDHWGTLHGETCVIELSGLAASSFAVDRDRNTFQQERIRVIRERIGQYKPAFVLMYSECYREQWEEIAGTTIGGERMRRIGNTVFVLVPHPVSRGLKKQDWIDWGMALRELM